MIEKPASSSDPPNDFVQTGHLLIEVVGCGYRIQVNHLHTGITVAAANPCSVACCFFCIIYPVFLVLFGFIEYVS
jgi:hypothetical protein